MNVKTTEEMKEMSLEELKKYEKWISRHASKAWHIRRYREMDND
tara:strand:- start:391 stop:522 length:132 start_codon:yes stop_codon:yes gene_type:complete